MTAIDFRQLFEGAPSLLLVLSPEFRIVAATDAYLAATNTSRESILGRGLFEVFPDNPDDPAASGVSKLRASLEQVLLHRQPHAMAVQKYDIPRPPELGGGFEERHWSPVNTPLFDAQGEIRWIVHRVEDVTAFVQLTQIDGGEERRTRELQRRSDKMEAEIYARADEMQRLNAQLLVTQQRFAAVFDHARDAIVAVEADGTIRLANRAVYQQFRHPTGGLRGRRIEELLPGFSHQPLPKGSIANAAMELQAKRSDGSTFPAELSVGDFVMDEGRASVLIIRDVTERHRLEQLKREFVASVNHEVRTPLTAIRGALDLVAHGTTGAISEPTQELIELARRNGAQLALLVDDLLDVEGLDSGRSKMQLQRLNLAPLLRDALQLHQPYADRHQVEFRLAAEPADGWVMGDGARLQQVLANLLSNAAKFSPPSSTIELGLEHRDGWLRVFVSDPGVGITENFRERIFQRFAQADSSDRRRFGGTGLGLSISKSIIEQHKGVIDFETQPGSGSRFWFDLPVAV